MLTIFISLLVVNIITSCLLILATYSFARQMYNESKRQQLVVRELVGEAERLELERIERVEEALIAKERSDRTREKRTRLKGNVTSG